ncbi:hypothetical protein EDC96DRAFT_587878 [Choanephora cucurbitarum]|nr:hypothetical protein EDC96DRAFT_587878 [Choanephora cucurbitarum]
MYELSFTGTNTSKNTIITVDSQGGLSRKITIKNDGEKLTVRSYDAGLIWSMIPLKQGEEISGKAFLPQQAVRVPGGNPLPLGDSRWGPGGKERVGHQQRAAPCVQLCCQEQGPDKDFRKVNFDDSEARERMTEEDHQRNRSVADKLMEKIRQDIPLTEDENLEVMNGVRVRFPSSSAAGPSSSSAVHPFQTHSSLAPLQEDLDLEQMNF